MGSPNRYDGIDPDVVRIIRHKAKTLVGNYGFLEADRQDLEQELTLDVFRRLPRFDPTRAQLATFVTRLVDHRIANIIEERTAQKRDYRLCRRSLNESVGDEDGESTELQEIISQEDYLRRTGRFSRPVLEQGEQRRRVARVMEQLSPELRELCRCLGYESVLQISRRTGTPRWKINEARKQIRARFEAAGLREYL